MITERTRKSPRQECNAPCCFAGLASKYFVGKEGVLSHCFVEFGQIKAGSFRWFGSRSGGIAPELLTKGSELIEDFGLACSLALKAEALHNAGRTMEALKTLREAEALAETRQERWWCAELYRLRGVVLTTLGADEAQIETSFHEAIRTAKEQKSVSLQKREKATYVEYRRQKASASAGPGFRLPLW